MDMSRGDFDADEHEWCPTCGCLVISGACSNATCSSHPDEAA